MEDQNAPWKNSVTGADEQPQVEYGTNVEPLEEVTWTASEFVSHQKTAMWYVGLGVAAAVVTLIVFALTKNILSGIVVAFAFMALGVFAARQPETIRYSINEDGVYVGERFFPYETFKSFSIVQDGAVNCIWLRPLKRFMPTTVMYYPPEEEDKILDTLENFLAQEDREHDAMDRISRKIRF